jgi:restriction system protein
MIVKDKFTIIDAALEVLKSVETSMSVQEIYQEIIDRALYVFHAQDPLSVLRVELRKHSTGIDFPTASKKKYFIYDETNGKYSALQNGKSIKEDADCLNQVRKLYDSYLKDFKENILIQLKRMNPYDFEKFCMKLLKVYGFSNVEVTQKTRDGGIDGYGKLKIGLAHMSVAFQCKRWDNTNISRKEIDAFRGAIQGEYEQGIFFTTSSFTKEAMRFSIKQGAVPIILIDGNMVVDFMIEKQFGIEHEELPIYVNAIDKIFI